jgi:L-threonylcarbamoyladenylate synthase
VTDAEHSRVVAVDPVAPTRATLRAAADTLRAGGVVALPTETFYGLAAAALDSGSVRRIFELKGRPESKPLLVLVDSVAMAKTVARVTDAARDLMARYWPGALTLVLPALPTVPSLVTAGTGTLGVRLSPHAIARGLVELLGEPVTAPSANPDGLPPPTTAAGVLTYFPEGIDLVLDGGATPGGEPSTVLDLTVDPPRVLRQGAVVVRDDDRQQASASPARRART